MQSLAFAPESRELQCCELCVEIPHIEQTPAARKKVSMKLGNTIVYVPDVAASLAFFEPAFGLQRKFLHDSGTYGELDTGETTRSFAAHELGDMNFAGGHVRQHVRAADGIRERA
jgi:hypothetical protein